MSRFLPGLYLILSGIGKVDHRIIGGKDLKGHLVPLGNVSCRWDSSNMMLCFLVKCPHSAVIVS